MTYEEFKIAWVDKEVRDFLYRRNMMFATQPIIDMVSNLFDWVFPIEMKETYKKSLADGSLQKRCGL